MKRLLFVLATLLAFAGCGEDKTVDVVVPVAVGAQVVESADSLAVCDSKMQGRMAYVSGSNELYYCLDGKWLLGVQGNAQRDSVYVFDTLKIEKKVVDTLYIEKEGESLEGCSSKVDTVNFHILHVTCGGSTFNMDNQYAFLSAPTYGDTLVDSRDGQKYRTVVIDGKTWMAENLNYEVDSSACLKNELDSCAKYGRLYSIAQAQEACPSGWHVSTDEEWKDMTDYVDAHNGDYSMTLDMMSREDWNGNDLVGFGMRRGGLIRKKGSHYDGPYAFFWTPMQSNPNRWMCWKKDDGHGTIFTGHYNIADLRRTECETNMMLSVRCVKD